MAWKGIVGRSFSPSEFETYCKTLKWVSWRPSFIVLHNTGIPTLAQRPNGFSKQHILNLESYYRDEQKWSAGPHLFIDDHQIWVFTPLTVTGRHSPAWNGVSLGVEMLGDYNVDAFKTGRGAKVRANAIAAMCTLSATLGLTADSLHLHYEDPITTHKDCPGKSVVKAEVIAALKAALNERYGAHDHLPHPAASEVA